MTLVFKTKKINVKQYYNAVRKCVMLNAADRVKAGKKYSVRKSVLSPYEVWQVFKKEVKTVILPVEMMDEYSHMFKHLEVDPKSRVAWGFTGSKEWYWFVHDSRNPMIFMQNLGPGFHEVLHMMYQLVVGTKHVEYKSTAPPEVRRAGQSGALATVVVHDNWYGDKTKVRAWFAVGIVLVPVPMPYIPIEKARTVYGIRDIDFHGRYYSQK